MSDCNICLYNEPDEIAYELDHELVSSDGAVKCCECGQRIPLGAQYELATLWFGDEDGPLDEEGEPEDDSRWKETYKTCVDCAEIADAFYCEGRIYGGMLWDSMHEVMGELKTSCFDKLTTPGAKAFLRSRWMQHKGLA